MAALLMIGVHDGSGRKKLRAIARFARFCTSGMQIERALPALLFYALV
jgi:hypothetical protein